MHRIGMEHRAGRRVSALAAGLERGDAESLREAVAQFDDELVRLCYLMVGDRELARDAVQNLWISVWRKPPRLRDRERLRGWLQKVAVNEVRQLVRKRDAGARAERQTRFQPPATIDSTESAVSERLAVILESLDEQERHLLGLRFILDLSAVQIGEQLGLSPEGARSRLHRLIKRIREEIVNVGIE